MLFGIPQTSDLILETNLLQPDGFVRIHTYIFRMRGRRVLVSRLGLWGLGVKAKSVRSVRKRSPVRKPRVLAGIRGRKLSRNAELSSLLDLHGVFASQVLTVLSGIGGVVVAKPRTVVAFGLVLRLRVSKVSTVTGIGKVVVAKRRTVVTFRLVLHPRVSKVSTVTGIGGVVVARTVVTFGLASVAWRRIRAPWWLIRAPWWLIRASWWLIRLPWWLIRAFWWLIRGPGG